MGTFIFDKTALSRRITNIEDDFDHVPRTDSFDSFDDYSRKQHILNAIAEHCTEENIRKRYCDKEIKEMKYDPNLYSVVATEALVIHRRLLKMFGTDVIRLLDSKFIEKSLQVMLKSEAEEAEQARLRRMRKGQETERRAERMEKWKNVTRRILKEEPVDGPRPSATKVKLKTFSHKKKQQKPHLATYDSTKHDFGVPETKYEMNYDVWLDDEENTARSEDVSLLFEEADDAIFTPNLPPKIFKMKRVGWDLDVPEITSDTVQESTVPILKKKKHKKQKETDKTGNNTTKERKEKEDAQQRAQGSISFSDLLTPSISLNLVGEGSSNENELDDDDEGNISTHEPQVVKPEEIDLSNPSVGD